MGIRISLSQIIDKVSTFKTKNEKIDWLRKCDSLQLRQLLRMTYDNEIKFLIPDTPPPWKKNDYIDVENMLYGEVRRMKIFIEGGGYDNLNNVKRESLFISLLEDIDNNDAELLCKVISKKPFKGLPKKTLEETFPNIYETKLV